jgi:hypothetical protein
MARLLGRLAARADGMITTVGISGKVLLSNRVPNRRRAVLRNGCAARRITNFHC